MWYVDGKVVRLTRDHQDLYFLGYDSPTALSHGNSVFDREGIIELT